MDPITSILPFLAVLVSALAVVPIVLCRRSANLREFWTFLAAAIKVLIVLSMVPIVLGGTTIEYTVWEILPGVPIAFKVDAFGLLFALVASTLWIVTSIYSVGYMRAKKEHSQTRYFSFFALALSATIGVAFSANLFTLYLFYEMLSLSTYPLVTHHQDDKARGAGRKYMGILLGASILLALPAMLLTYAAAGTLDFRPGGIMAGTVTLVPVVLLVLAFVFGFAKAGVMPLHAWLPNAMVAPTPVSALLHAVAVVKVGVFSIVRVIIHIFGTGFLDDMDAAGVVAAVAATTVVLSSLIALSQDELKRRLAFSTIGQLSYIILGAALIAPLAVTGGILHIGMHAFGKITLFFCAGAIYVATGRTRVSQLDGIGRRMPWTMGAFVIGSMSVIGLPPTGGFISKWYLVLGSVDSKSYIILVVFLVSTLLNAAYFFPIVFRAFFVAPKDPEDGMGIREAPLFCVLPPVLTAIVSLALFLKPDLFEKLAVIAAGGG